MYCNNPFSCELTSYWCSSAAGGKDNGPPGLRKQYFPTYYGAFVLDPDGRNIEVVCLKPEILAEPLGWVGWGAVGVVVSVIAGGVGKWAELI
jgi:hypothetical protein